MFARTRCIALLCTIFIAAAAWPQAKPAETAAKPQTVTLPAPQKRSAVSLEEVLAKRRSVRDFAATPLTDQELGQLLWAMQGVTDDKGHRTAPSAMARYPLEVYVATAKGVFHYLPKEHALETITDKDLRRELTSQGSMSAPAVFLVTADFARMGQRAGDRGKNFVFVEAGHVAQNLLLQATAMRLAGVPVGGFTDEQVKKALPALPYETIYLLPIGHPKTGS